MVSHGHKEMVNTDNVEYRTGIFEELIVVVLGVAIGHCQMVVLESDAFWVYL